MTMKSINLNAIQSGPAGDYAAVTPADNTKLPGGQARALYIGVTGDVAIRSNWNSVAVVFKAVPVGILPVSVWSVDATNTTATNIAALF